MFLSSRPQQDLCFGLDLQSVEADPANDPLQPGTLYASDELRVSLYMSLTGFYRQAIGAVRGAVENIVTGAYFRAFPDPAPLAAIRHEIDASQALWIEAFVAVQRSHFGFPAYEQRVSVVLEYCRRNIELPLHGLPGRRIRH